MKEGIHPTWYSDAVVVCSCGNTWTTASTKKEIHTDVCNKCHPFYTGEQRIVDTAGQVERFMKRISAKEQLAAAQPAPDEKKAKKDKRRERKAPESLVAAQAPADLPLAVVEDKPAAVDEESVAEKKIEFSLTQTSVAEPVAVVEEPVAQVVEPVVVEEPVAEVVAEPVAEEPAVVTPVVVVEEAVAPVAVVEEHHTIAKRSAADDLKIIEGIGPKIAGVLHDAGINSLSDLAGTSVEKLQEILKAAQITIANPSTWAEQAQLAADGKLDELKALQASLVGGRRVEEGAKPRAPRKPKASATKQDEK